MFALRPMGLQGWRLMGGSPSVFWVFVHWPMVWVRGIRCVRWLGGASLGVALRVPLCCADGFRGACWRGCFVRPTNLRLQSTDLSPESTTPTTVSPDVAPTTTSILGVQPLPLVLSVDYGFSSSFFICSLIWGYIVNQINSEVYLCHLILLYCLLRGLGNVI